MRNNVFLFETSLDTFQVDLINPLDRNVRVIFPSGEFLLLPFMKLGLYRNSFRDFKFDIGKWFSNKPIKYRVKEIREHKIKTIDKLV